MGLNLSGISESLGTVLRWSFQIEKEQVHHRKKAWEEYSRPCVKEVRGSRECWVSLSRWKDSRLDMEVASDGTEMSVTQGMKWQGCS